MTCCSILQPDDILANDIIDDSNLKGNALPWNLKKLCICHARGAAELQALVPGN